MLKAVSKKMSIFLLLLQLNNNYRLIHMTTYPKILKRKDLKKISKYSCDEEIKEAYIKYLPNYPFKEFVKYCEDNTSKGLDELIFSFTDLQLEKFEPNSMIWLSHVMINFMIYFKVNLDYDECYDAYASALQLTVLSYAIEMVIKKIPFEEVPFPQHSKICFEEFFKKCQNVRFNLKTDCNLAYKSFNEDFDFTCDEFYLKVKEHFDENEYKKE